MLKMNTFLPVDLRRAGDVRAVAGDLQVAQMEGEDLFQGIMGLEDVAGVLHVAARGLLTEALAVLHDRRGRRGAAGAACPDWRIRIPKMVTRNGRHLKRAGTAQGQFSRHRLTFTVHRSGRLLAALKGPIGGRPSSP
jgi:hypothetical protein